MVQIWTIYWFWFIYNFNCSDLSRTNSRRKQNFLTSSSRKTETKRKAVIITSIITKKEATINLAITFRSLARKNTVKVANLQRDTVITRTKATNKTRLTISIMSMNKSTETRENILIAKVGIRKNIRKNENENSEDEKKTFEWNFL